MQKQNKKIQEERIKSYFVEATKKILKGEGLKSINVRNIAKEAGYSYATLYNYFKDAKELVFECIKDFKHECVEHVSIETKKSQRGLPKIKAITFSYMKFFIQYPSIFELFYIERANDLGYKLPTLNLVHSLYEDLTNDEWEYCIQNNIISSDESKIISETLKNLTLGILTMYINRYYPKTYSEYQAIIKRQVESILEKK